jgi:hypothetical protein
MLNFRLLCTVVAAACWPFVGSLRAGELPGVDCYGDRVVKKDTPFSKEDQTQQKDKQGGTGPEQIDKLKKLGAKIQLDDKNRVIGVNLGERRISDADLIHLKGLDDLQELDLTRTGVTSAGLENLKELTTLKKLFLTETRVDDNGIGSLQGLQALELLGLSGTKIGDPALTQLQALTGLKSLFCIGTAVTEAGVATLRKALPQCRITN